MSCVSAVAAERLLALVDGDAVEHHRDMRDLRADLEQRDDLAGAAFRQLGDDAVQRRARHRIRYPSRWP
jgi:hypothetical protein